MSTQLTGAAARTSRGWVYTTYGPVAFLRRWLLAWHLPYAIVSRPPAASSQHLPWAACFASRRKCLFQTRISFLSLVLMVCTEQFLSFKRPEYLYPKALAQNQRLHWKRNDRIAEGKKNSIWHTIISSNPNHNLNLFPSLLVYFKALFITRYWGRLCVEGEW